MLIGKVYVQRPDAPAEAEQMLRVVDEDTSEPDGYLYPSAFFVPVVLPEKAQRAVLNSLG